ncbi:MAG: translocation/assembly module TamB domain-containing protein [Cyanobacteria bacterium P01_A01_bin.84]
MTSPNTPPENTTPERIPPKQSWSRYRNLLPTNPWLRGAMTLGVAIAGVGVVGYFGLDYWIRSNVPSLVEKQLGEYINRQVRVGEVQTWSLGGIRIGKSSIPATATNPDYVQAEAIDVKFGLLPVLFSRTLPIDITFVKPDVYVQQNQQGEWLELDLDTDSEGELPFKIDAKVSLQEGKFTVLPQFSRTPIIVSDINGDAEYSQNQPEQVEYDVNAAIAGGRVGVEGETKFGSGETKGNVSVTGLVLPEVNRYIPNLPIGVTNGRLNANLKVNLVAFSELPFINGIANIQNLRVKSKQLPLPITADSLLRFDGRKVSLEKTSASYGNLKAGVSGNVDLEKGYNLKAETNTFDIANTLKSLTVAFPVNLAGKLQTKMLLRGKLEKPVLLANVISKSGIVVDKTVFSKVDTVLAGNINGVMVEKFSAVPAVGGEIIARGEAIFPTLRGKDNKTSNRDFTKTRLVVDFGTRLPNTGTILAPYGVDSDIVKLGRLTANGRIRGTVASPVALVNWQLPGVQAKSVGEVSGNGKLLFVENKLVVEDTTLRTAEGKVNVNGGADLATNNFEALVSANTVALNPFLAKLEVDESLRKTSLFLRQGKVKVVGNLNALELENIRGIADLKLNVNKGNVAIQSQLKRGVLQARADARGINLNKIAPNLPVDLTVANSRVNIAGLAKQLTDFNSIRDLTSFRAAAVGNLVSGETKGRGNINFNARGNLGTQNWQAFADINALPIRPFLSESQKQQLRIKNKPVILQTGKVVLAGNLDVVDSNNQLDANKIQGAADLNLNVNNGRVRVQSTLEQGLVKAIANASRIPVNQFLPQLPVNVNLANGRVKAVAQLDRILESDLQSITAAADAKLSVARGTVIAKAALENGNWASNINAANINTPLVCREFSLSCPEVSPLQGKFDLAGNIQPFLKTNSPAIIQVNSAYVRTKSEGFKAAGNILLNPPNINSINSTNFTNPANSTWDVAANLNINARGDLSKLPPSLVSQIESQLQQGEIPIRGIVDFSGSLLGEKLVSAPLANGNLQLTGNLKLRDFAVNQVAFDPLLTGLVNVNLGENIAVDLRGTGKNADRIAAQLQPCNREDCISPYLPTFFQLKQGRDSKNPILLTGKRRNDLLNVKFDDFSLALLNILPQVKENLDRPLGGQADGNLNINLFTLGTSGEVNIDSPSLGNIKANKLVANFAYNDGLAEVAGATLNLGQSKYNLAGRYNLNSGDINGKLEANSAKIQDVLAVVNAFNSPEAAKDPNYGNARDVATQPVGNPKASLGEQLNLLVAINKRIQQQAANNPNNINNKSIIPIDVRGTYNAKITVDGKLSDPQATFQVEGDKWKWYPQPELVAEKPDKNTKKITEGNTKKNNQENTGEPIEINDAIAKGSFKEGTLNIETVQANVEDGTISLTGGASLLGGSGQLKVRDLPVELASVFVNLPVDVDGKVNLDANLDASIFGGYQIQEGQFSIDNGTVNKQPLGELAGTFSYIGRVAKLTTTPGSFVKLDAAVPYPPRPGKNSIDLDALVDTKTLALVGAFTDNQIQWINGEGQIGIKANGEVNWQGQTLREISENLTATSTVNINNATIKSKQLSENIELTATGNINLENQIFQVKELEGSLSGSPFLITGALPISRSTTITDPNIPKSLQVSLGPGKLNLKGLYKGNIDANINVTQTATRPIIGGELTLAKGRVYVPKQEEPDEQEEKKQENQENPGLTQQSTELVSEVQELRNTPNNQPFTIGNSNFFVQPRFQDFKLTLGKGFRFKRSFPDINFLIAGGVTVNGGLDNLEGEGQLRLRRGKVSILRNLFFITRDREQTITFVPSQGLLNPNLDVELQTAVINVPRFDRPQPIGSEIREDILEPPNPEQIDVRISVTGRASQLIPALDRTAENSCKSYSNLNPFRPQTPIPTNSPKKLQGIATCINQTNQASLNTTDLLNNPAINLESTPSRNDTEILALLGNRTLATITDIERQLNNGDEVKLLESLVEDYVITPLRTELTQEFLWQVQRPINRAGKTIGLTKLQVFPDVTGIKDINQNSSARFTYDYDAGEFRVLYEQRF